MVSIGWKAAHEQYSPEDLLEHSILAERAGMDSVWASDHFLPWSHTGAHSGFAWVWMSAVAARTKELSIGTGVTAPILRYNPGIVAQAFATLGRMFPERIRLGVGSGEPMNEVPLGYDWPSAKERLERMEEAIRIIRMLWNQDFVSFQGKYYRLEKARLYTKPRRPIPIYVAAFTPEAAKIVGRYGDGFYSFLGRPIEYYTQTLFPTIKREAERSNRNFEHLYSAIEILFSYDRYDIEKALASASFWKGTLAPITKNIVYDPREIEEYGSKVSDEIVEKTWVITTDPEKIIERAEECFHAGFKQVVLMSSSPNQKATLKMLGREVVPQLKQQHSTKK